MRWQYQIATFDVPHQSNMQTYLNQQGASAWELVNVAIEQTPTGLLWVLFMKRPAP